MKRPEQLPGNLLLITLLATALSACGGGSSSSDSATAVTPANPVNPVAPVTPVAPVSGDTGSVSAPFAGNASARYLLLAVASQSTGALTSVSQGANGALSEIAGAAFTGTPAITREISGDASFAQGRWFTGTITRSTGATVMSGNNASAHYNVYKTLASLPASGSLACDAGTFTAPSYTGGGVIGQDAYFGAASGSATLSFGATGASLAMTVNASAGGQQASISGAGLLAAPASTAIGGGFLGGSSGTLLALGDAGAGRYLVIGGYKVVLANGASYQGVATFRCS
ncbi:hypothetical protein [Janthinobacterium psychrotolerans]|uniref:Transferrin-binding protein B C-lobe/N-lobe beta barrel domain-containing protein n=1 Tax=Janthinobacterium psychrotolerans TaxID=1747903 RepID=A0A1A7C8F7_9BURK|nr:hypothetical protein [Janthinobacterium psychrotolerans]OBV40603.1 hypothetical protein ASR47_1017103 [Janthinobacterium psychrotolerans]